MKGKTYHRSQILLEHEQYKKLSSIAHRRQRSISDLTREMVRLGLSQIEAEDNQAIDALQRLISRRMEFYSGGKIYKTNPIDQSRKERSKQIATRLKNKR